MRLFVKRKFASAMNNSSNEIIRRLLIAYGIPEKRGWQAALAQRTGVLPNVVSGWKKRGVPDRIISNAVIQTGCPKEWILSGEDERPAPINYPSEERRTPAVVAEGSFCFLPGHQKLTPAENMLLVAFRGLSEDQQRVILRVTEAEAAENQAMKRKTEKSEGEL
jgi:hypothetical protein